MRTRRRFLFGILFLLLSSFALLFITRSEKYVPVFSQGVSLWAVCVLPATFPFLFLTTLFSELGFSRKFTALLSPFVKKCYALPPLSAFVLGISLLSGYPVGAKLLSDLKEQGYLSTRQAEEASVLCSTSGPLFILGSVGSVMFHSRVFGAILFFSHVLAVLLSAFLFRGREKSELSLPPVKPPQENVLYSCMLSSVLSILCVGGFIAVFYLLSQMLVDLLSPFPFFSRVPYLLSTLSGLIEMTGGCKSLSLEGGLFALPLCAFLITLGGSSILFQQIAYLKKAGIPVRRFLLSKAVSSVLAFFLCLLFCLSMPRAA